jgi:deoxyribodipyrimidine photolyase
MSCRRDLSTSSDTLLSDHSACRYSSKMVGNSSTGIGLTCSMVEVESDAIVPVAVASDKQEYAARTIRPKIHRELNAYLAPLEETKPVVPFRAKLPSVDVTDVDLLLSSLAVDRSVARTTDYVGGEKEARKRLRQFVRDKLSGYHSDRNDPNLDGVSNLSPYLHFGQISCLDIALEVKAASGDETSEGVEAFLEELIVRRELSINFCTYTPNYDQYDCLPEWAQLTLDGRDVNSFAGVAWCFGKHDRPWQERPVFGMIRYMNANGLRRKFKADEYVAKIEGLSGRRLAEQASLF